MAFQPVTIPLVKGLDVSTDPATGSASLDYAENVQYTTDGVVKGRPGRASADQFTPRIPTASPYPSWASPEAFESTGFTSLALHQMRDRNGVRPGLACAGRLFANDGGVWRDKGPAHCLKVSRTNYQVAQQTTRRDACAQDFGRVTSFLGGLFYQLNAPSGDLDRLIEVDTNDWTSGTSARCGTTTAVVVYHANTLRLVYRTNGADTLAFADIAVDARAPTEVGDSPVLCCSADATNFWVAYMTTTANQYKVLNVSITGTVTATFTGTFAGLAGIWVDNTTIATNRVMVAVTGTAGLLVKTLNASTLVDIGTDSTVASGPGQDVVIGRESDTRFWWAYRKPDFRTGTLLLGVCTVGSAGSAINVDTWYSDTSNSTAGNGTCEPRWSIVHQPILVDGRVYLTLGCSADTTGNWITLDLSNWRIGSTGPGPFSRATPVARGPSNAQQFYQQPSSATILPSGNGWTFVTLDYSRFATVASTNITGLVSGSNPSLGVNTVVLSRPQAAQFGESTVFSGSVPFVVSGGQCQDLGFPFLAGTPGMDAQVAAGGAMPVGTYQALACWVHVDEAGQIIRSAPSAQFSLTTTAGNQTIKAMVTNPWISAKEFGSIRLELYMSTAGGTVLYLQQTVDPLFTDGYTVITQTAAPSSSREVLYTQGGIFPNVHVPGDGGVCASGRRLWMATGTVVWASKYRLDGVGPEFSDVAGAGGLPSLRVALPAGAGRVVALEAMDTMLVIFCERGVYVVPDGGNGGPDNLGIGPDFSAPHRVTDLGCANSRATAWTDKGIAFVSPLSNSDPNIGGIWLVDRGLGVSLLSSAIAGRFGRTWTVGDPNHPPELTYVPEKQWLAMTVALPGAPAYGGGDSGRAAVVLGGGNLPGIAIMDLRVGKWCTWATQTYTRFKHIAAVAGVLWASEESGSTVFGPRAFSQDPGSDVTDGAVMMSVLTSHMPATGGNSGPYGWGRVRSVGALATGSSGSYTRYLAAVLDQTTLLTENASGVSTPAPAASTGWPSGRQSNEWRLPQQKCSTIQVLLQATPATAEWTHLAMQVKPMGVVTPGTRRS